MHRLPYFDSYTDICAIFRREDVMDVEISASGFTKQMAVDLLVGMGIDEGQSDGDCSENESDDENAVNLRNRLA